MRAHTHASDDHDLLWESETLQVHTCSVSSMDNNVYVVTCRSTGHRALVDAADDMPRIFTLLTHAGGVEAVTSIASIITTHRHWDHHRALVDAVEATDATTYAGAPDADHLPTHSDVRLKNGDTISIGQVEVEVSPYAVTPLAPSPSPFTAETRREPRCSSAETACFRVARG